MSVWAKVSSDAHCEASDMLRVMLSRPALFGALAVMSVGCQALLSLGPDPGPDASVAVDGGGAAHADATASDAADASDASVADASVDAEAYCPPSGAMTAGSCPGGQLWHGRCYFVAMPPEAGVAAEVDAIGQCAEAGAYLATVTCPAEWAEVLEPLKRLGQNVWLGATRSQPDQPPTWKYTNEPWTFANPAYPVPEEAGVGCLNTNKDGQWGIIACTSNNAFAMCEIGPFVGQ